ncbi:MAG: hemolysin family protein [Muribaculaceae bacterium]|nr:hemolysin family protein [Muribaculaceae bacterium]MDE5857076.1 hemolysin family protein [Muribaculaceae bacterium]
MTDDLLAKYLLIIVTLIFSAIFSGVEMAFVTGDRVRVELDIKRGGTVSRILNVFYNNPSFFISTILVGNNIALVVYGQKAAEVIDNWLQSCVSNEALILIFSSLISTGVILISGEFIPKTIFSINPNTSLKFFSIPIFAIYVILYPISMFTTWISKTLMKIFGIKDTESSLGYLSVGDLNQYLERSIDHNGNSSEEIENEVKIFHNALDFSQIHLRDCMIPRNEIVAVDVDNTTEQQLSDLFTKSGRSKIIVYKEDIDNILGYIHVSELFHRDKSWKDNIKEVIYAPETLKANKMMKRLLAEKRSIAIIVDEFGGTAGMVTLEDLVEEIFGDIQDEHDHARIIQRQIGPNTYEFSGRIEIEYLNETYPVDIPEDDDYQTLAGYILHSLGSIPEQGEEIVLGDLTFEVMKKTETRLELIKVTVHEHKSE